MSDIALIVDDEPANIMVESRMLQKAGLEVKSITNGLEAVNYVKDRITNGDELPKLVVMDLRMPIMDGYEATAKLRFSGYDGYILACSANRDIENRHRVIEAGADEFMSKPVNYQRLIELAHTLYD